MSTIDQEAKKKQPQQQLTRLLSLQEMHFASPLLIHYITILLHYSMYIIVFNCLKSV